MKRKRKKKGDPRGLGCCPSSQRGIGWQESCLCEITAPTTASSHTVDAVRTEPPHTHYDGTFHVLLDAPLQVANIDASRESVVGGSAAADVLDLRLTLKANKEEMQNFMGEK